MVLLNNNNNALPLSPSTANIAVVGPLADDALDQLGPDVPIGYDTTPADLKTHRQDRHGRRRDQDRRPERDRDHRARLRDVHVTDPCNETTGFGAAVDGGARPPM